MPKTTLPCIGISVATFDTVSAKAIASLVERSGGMAVLFDAHKSRDPAADIARIDALVLMGNDLDIDPEYYIHRYSPSDAKRGIHPETKVETKCELGKARAKYEFEMLAHAIERAMPLVGICGGMQRINVHLGGTLHQHLPDLVGDNRHCQRTRGVDLSTAEIPIIIEGGTLLAEIAEEVIMPFILKNSTREPKVILENSVHHQAVDEVAPHLRACCFAERLNVDDAARYLIKGIERDPMGLYKDYFILGIQWHPEFRASGFGECMVKRIVKEAKKYRKKKK